MYHDSIQRKGTRMFPTTIHTNTNATRRYHFTLSNQKSSLSARSYSYPILVQDQPDWPAFVQRMQSLAADHFTVVADNGLPETLIAEVTARFRETGTPFLVVQVSASEQQKTLETAMRIVTSARAAGGGTHRSCFVALGGGVIGNIAGLAAALLVRGVRLIHVPTTLLAATDSILSLKQGVNVRDGYGRLIKNLLGTFYAPEWVLVYTSFWQTLPKAEICAGLCELVKNAIGIHPQHIEEVLTLLQPEARYTPQECQRIFELCFAAKQEVMRADAHEKGPALVLELGHTFGHAWESHTGLTHGLSVGLGLLVEAQIAANRGWLSSGDIDLITGLLDRNGALTTLPADLDTEAILALMRADNKIGYLPHRPGFSVMVLLQRLGQPSLTQGLPLAYVAEAEVRSAIASLQR